MKYKIVVYLIIVIIFILLPVDFYLSKDYYLPTTDAFLGNPGRHAGKVVEFIGPVLNVSAESFYMGVNKRALRVYYEGLEKPKLGQIAVLAELNSDGTVNALEVHKFSYGYIKYIISFLGFILFLFIFFREWKFKRWRLVENA